MNKKKKTYKRNSSRKKFSKKKTRRKQTRKKRGRRKRGGMLTQDSLRDFEHIFNLSTHGNREIPAPQQREKYYNKINTMKVMNSPKAEYFKIAEMAIHFGLTWPIKYLLDQGLLKINDKDDNGDTLLHLFAKTCYLPMGPRIHNDEGSIAKAMAKFLFLNGAKIGIKNKQNKTAMNITEDALNDPQRSNIKDKNPWNACSTIHNAIKDVLKTESAIVIQNAFQRCRYDPNYEFCHQVQINNLNREMPGYLKNEE